jgi:hypothetical protein
VFFSAEKLIKKPGLERKGPLDLIIQSWVDVFFDYCEKSKKEQKELRGFWATLFKYPGFPWLRLEGKHPFVWAEVLADDSYPEILINMSFPVKQHYTTLFSDKQIVIPSNLTVSGFKSKKYMTFKGIVAKTELTRLLIQVFSKIYGRSEDSVIYATLTG